MRELNLNEVEQVSGAVTNFGGSAGALAGAYGAYGFSGPALGSYFGAYAGFFYRYY